MVLAHTEHFNLSIDRYLCVSIEKKDSKRFKRAFWTRDSGLKKMVANGSESWRSNSSKRLCNRCLSINFIDVWVINIHNAQWTQTINHSPLRRALENRLRMEYSFALSSNYWKHCKFFMFFSQNS